MTAAEGGTKMSVENRVKEIIAKQLKLGVDEIRSEARFVEDLGMDSLDVVELAMDIEDEYRVEIPDEQLEQLHTVGELVKHLDSLVPTA